jgi:hypothetical protein
MSGAGCPGARQFRPFKLIALNAPVALMVNVACRVLRASVSPSDVTARCKPFEVVPFSSAAASAFLSPKIESEATEVPKTAMNFLRRIFMLPFAFKNSESLERKRRAHQQ